MMVCERALLQIRNLAKFAILGVAAILLLISPVDAQSLGPSIGSTYYTPNIPFAVLKEVTNRIPTLLATSIGGRKLQNFDELNDLLGSISVVLPEIEPFSIGTFFFAEAFLGTDAVICNDISVQDLQISHSRLSVTEVALDISIVGLGFDCFIDWSLDWAIDSDGIATVNTTQNTFNLQYTFSSPNFDVEPPTAAIQSDCDVMIEIDDIDASGGTAAWLLNAFEGFMRTPIEDVLGTFLCPQDPSDELIGPLLTDLVMSLDALLEPFQQPIPDELKDPLFPEKNLVAPTGVDFIGFSSAFGPVIQTLFDSVNFFLGGIVDDPNSPSGGQDLAINKILRDSVLNENGALVLDGTMFGTLYGGEDVLTESVVSVETINIYGLDTISEFVPIQSIGEYTMATNFDWKEIDIDIILRVEVTPSEGEGSVISGGKGTVIETILIQMGLRDIEIDFAAMFAISLGNVTDTLFGSLTDFEMLLSCLSDSIHDIEVTNMNLSIGDVIPPTLEGFISPGLDNVISSLSRAVFEMYEGPLIAIMPYIFQGMLRKSVNDAIDLAISGTEKCRYESRFSGDIVNLPDLLLPPTDAVSVGGSGTKPYGTLLPLAFGTIINEVKTGIVGGGIDVNGLIRKVTSAQSGIAGKIDLGELINVDYGFILGSSTLKILLQVYDTNIINLDTFGSPFDLLNTVAPQLLENVAAIGVGGNPVKATTNIMFGIELPGSVGGLQNDLEISVEMQDLVLNMVLFMSIVEERLMNMSFEDITNLNCLMSTLLRPNLDANGLRVDNSKSLDFEELTMIGKKNALSLKCNMCSSDGIESAVNLFRIGSVFLDTTSTVNSLLEVLMGFIRGDGFRVDIDRYLDSSRYQCPSNEAFNSSYTATVYPSLDRPFSTVPEAANSFIRNFIIVLVFLIAVVLTILILVRRDKKRRLEASKMTMTVKQYMLINSQQRSNQHRDSKLNEETASMFRTKSIPLIIRILVPIIILVNIGLFLSGHLSLGAQVDLNVGIAGESLTLPRIFDFSLSGSVKDMWNNGAKELAVFIAIFSGIWPYTKQSITFFLWFSPTRWVSVKRRESILTWLDSLGKWSFVDIFVLFMSLVGFRITVEPPAMDLIPVQLYGVDLLVIPKWGLYSNMIAQILSQLSSHFILHYHRKIEADCLQDLSSTSDNESALEKTSLRKHKFCDINGNNDASWKGVDIAVVVFAFVVVGIFLCGCILDVFSIESFGIIGVAIELGQNFEEAIKRFSFFDVVKLVIAQASYTGVTADYVGLLALSIVFLWTVLIAPMAQLALLMYRWFVPMNRKGRRRNFVAVESIMAWQYSEVFLLSIVIAAWQLGPISEYMVNDYCGSFQDFFVSAVTSGVLDALDGQCFRAEASINIGAWFLFSGALGLALLNHFVGKAARQQEEEDEWKERSRSLPQDSGEEDLDTIEIKSTPPGFTDYYRWLLRTVTVETNGRIAVAFTEEETST